MVKTVPLKNLNFEKGYVFSISSGAGGCLKGTSNLKRYIAQILFSDERM